ncbi:hypothetical protein HOE37_06755 [Candidatus Woesearchaeota archaeon]|jgi:hypothetical protein|nr:hypothetical protein [Candidatus Woesearchaeota archaeon]
MATKKLSINELLAKLEVKKGKSQNTSVNKAEVEARRIFKEKIKVMEEIPEAAQYFSLLKTLNEQKTKLKNFSNKNNPSYIPTKVKQYEDKIQELTELWANKEKLEKSLNDSISTLKDKIVELHDHAVDTMNSKEKENRKEKEA